MYKKLAKVAKYGQLLCGESTSVLNKINRNNNQNQIQQQFGIRISGCFHCKTTCCPTCFFFLNCLKFIHISSCINFVYWQLVFQGAFFFFLTHCKAQIQLHWVNVTILICTAWNTFFFKPITSYSKYKSFFQYIVHSLPRICLIRHCQHTFCSTSVSAFES